jgi:hypothetical protein
MGNYFGKYEVLSSDTFVVDSTLDFSLDYINKMESWETLIPGNFKAEVGPTGFRMEGSMFFIVPKRWKMDKEKQTLTYLLTLCQAGDTEGRDPIWECDGHWTFTSMEDGRTQVHRKMSNFKQLYFNMVPFALTLKFYVYMETRIFGQEMAKLKKAA